MLRPGRGRARRTTDDDRYSPTGRAPNAGRAAIVDCDAHVDDAPAALTPYSNLPWRRSLEALAETPARYLDIPGYAPSLKLHLPIPGGQPMRSVPTAATTRAAARELATLEAGMWLVGNVYNLCLPRRSLCHLRTAIGPAGASSWSEPAPRRPG